MEGVFAFFLESTFVGLLLWGEQRLGPRMHWVAAFLVLLGSWFSGFFVIATNAWIKHPTSYLPLARLCEERGPSEWENCLLNHNCPVLSMKPPKWWKRS